ncbi:glycosyltransferase, partial [Sphingomonas sp.]|uniref:glycosyltransferase n=1 Tax=Sphingomonas sp. TaxID=28214 RepID=UPI00286BFBDF
MIHRPSQAGHARQPVVVLAVNSLWNILNFRMGLIGALQQEGYRIVVVSPAGDGAELLASRGVSVRPIRMSARGTSPFADARLLVDFYRALREIRPDALLAFTAKPNIYGSLAARALGIPALNNVAGLGSAFTRQTWLTRLMMNLYKLALKKSHVVFLQNPDDRALFVGGGIVTEQQAGLLPGSGVDLDRFRPVEEAAGRAAPFSFLLPARLLWAKGLAEYVEAARRIRADGGG